MATFDKLLRKYRNVLVFWPTLVWEHLQEWWISGLGHFRSFLSRDYSKTNCWIWIILGVLKWWTSAFQCIQDYLNLTNIFRVIAIKKWQSEMSWNWLTSHMQVPIHIYIYKLKDIETNSIFYQKSKDNQYLLKNNQMQISLKIK